MSAEQNKALIRRFFEEGINQNKPSVFDETLAPNYVNHNMPVPAPGPEGIKQVISMFFIAFPDFRVMVEDAIAEGD
ncbi:MAG: ester cyclase, partial [Chloroflexi bacterium]|nr:ester cyclase [Chloroflexota bacterium]